MKKTTKIIIVLFVVAIIVIASIALLLLNQDQGETSIEKVPDFTLVDIDGNNVTMSDLTGKVVVLDFMYIDCPSCRIAEKNVKAVYPLFEDEIHIISIDSVPSDTDEALRNHRDESGIALENWTIARDAVQPGGGYVYQLYNVNEFVTIYIIDKEGYATYYVAGAPSSEELEREINKAIAGTQPIGIPQIGLALLAVVAGLATFFSPCAFPMLPGYMAYFLGLQMGQKEKNPEKIYRKAVFGGLSGGIGIISIYIIIGLLIVSLGTAISGYVPLLGPIVGIMLIILGILMLTNIQYNRIVKPFQVLASKFSRKKKEEAKDGEAKGSKEEEKDKTKGYYIKLFRYGVGYGAAASACVAPLFIVLVVSASAASITGTFLDGLIVLLLYAFVVIGLMVSITILLTYFGQKATQKLSKYTEPIKKISAAVLIIVGAYLVGYYIYAFIL